ncbi:MAG: HVO_A0114 family putative DNA-binding protein [Gammaproteobacteria bacterium]
MAGKAIVGVESHEAMLRRSLEIARRVDRGERVPEADYHLNFANAAQLFSELTPERMRLLEVLKTGGAQSIYALAKTLGRNYSNVHRDVQRLLKLELVGKDEHDRIHVPWEEVLISLRLGVAA